MVESKSTFVSKIFAYEDPINALNLHVSFQDQHKDWIAEDIKLTDVAFQQKIFADPVIMASFGDGTVRTPESVETRAKNSIDVRFGKGSPHGLLTVFEVSADGIERIPFMSLIGGGGDRPGTSEIAYASLPTHWNATIIESGKPPKHYGSRIVCELVNTWAPEVYRIGHGIDLDPVADANIIKAFSCFGGKPLDQLDATASPANAASWKILERAGFTAAKCSLENPDVITINFDGKDFGSFADMEKELLKLYEDPNNDNPLKGSKRYRMIDPAGKERTVSKHIKYQRMKYHFEQTSFKQKYL